MCMLKEFLSGNVEPTALNLCLNWKMTPRETNHP